MTPRPPIYGIMAEFTDVNQLVRAVRESRAAGFRRLDAYTPFAVEEVGEALDAHERRLPALVLVAGILGGLAGFMLQYWTSAIDYPLNVGGRPLNSWPAFVPVTFECAVLAASLAAVLGLLGLNGLPMPYHPVFNAPRFALSSRDRFFLCIEADDPKFDRETTRQFLERLAPFQVSEVAH
jgi:hypothetical protein